MGRGEKICFVVSRLGNVPSDKSDSSATTARSKHIFQIVFVFLFLSIQSFLRESIQIGFFTMILTTNNTWELRTLTQSTLLFFIFHVIMQIPAGMWAEVYGAKIVMQSSMLFCACCSICTPSAIIFGGKPYFILATTLQGLGQGCFIPSFYVFTSQWVSLQQRSIIFSAAFGGMHFGSAVGIPIIELICRLSWFAGYILASCLGLLWVLCSVFVMSTWDVRQRLLSIDRVNLNKLLDTTKITEKGVEYATPWRGIFTSLPFWSTMLDHFGSVWLNNIFLHNMSYFHIIYDVTLNEVFLSAPFVISFFMIFVFGTATQILDKLKFPRTNKRKIMNCFALWGGSAILGILAMWSSHTYVTTLVAFWIGSAFSSAAYCGVFMNHAELSPMYAGTLMGISNVVGNMAGFVQPMAQQLIVKQIKSKTQWRIYFGTSAGVLFFSNLLFVIYGTTEIQGWHELDEWMMYGAEKHKSVKAEQVEVEQTEIEIFDRND